MKTSSSKKHFEKDSHSKQRRHLVSDRRALAAVGALLGDDSHHGLRLVAPRPLSRTQLDAVREMYENKCVGGVLHFLSKKTRNTRAWVKRRLEAGKPGTHTYPLGCRHLWTTFGSGWGCGRVFKSEEVNMGPLQTWRWKREGWGGLHVLCVCARLCLSVLCMCSVCALLCAAPFRLCCTVSEMKEGIR